MGWSGERGKGRQKAKTKRKRKPGTQPEGRKKTGEPLKKESGAAKKPYAGE